MPVSASLDAVAVCAALPPSRRLQDVIRLDRLAVAFGGVTLALSKASVAGPGGSSSVALLEKVCDLTIMALAIVVVTVGAALRQNAACV